MNSFVDIMLKKSNSELIKIITSPSDYYQASAIEAAQLEVANRNISQEEISFIGAKYNAERNILAEKSQKSLDTVFKVLLFLFPMAGIVVKMIASMMLEKQGYERKSGEIFKWTALGICFYMILIILSSIFL